MKRLIATGAVVLGVLFTGCGGDDDEAATTSASPETAPPASAPPPSDVSGLPPGFAECMADQGFEVQSPADIHSAPPQVLQQCFGH